MEKYIKNPDEDSWPKIKEIIDADPKVLSVIGITDTDNQYYNLDIFSFCIVQIAVLFLQSNTGHYKALLDKFINARIEQPETKVISAIEWLSNVKYGEVCCKYNKAMGEFFGFFAETYPDINYQSHTA